MCWSSVQLIKAFSFLIFCISLCSCPFSHFFIVFNLWLCCFGKTYWGGWIQVCLINSPQSISGTISCKFLQSSATRWSKTSQQLLFQRISASTHNCHTRPLILNSERDRRCRKYCWLKFSHRSRTFYWLYY